MSTSFWRNPYAVLIFATLIIVFGYGSRQSFGMFIRPVSEALGFPGIAAMSDATAFQALIYGFSAPFVGAISDRWGPIKMLMGASLLYSGGIFLMSQSVTPEGMLLSIGFFTGVGSRGVALPMLLSIAGRVAPEERRGLWLGIVTAGATAGQMLVVPLSQQMIAGIGWQTAAMILATLVLMILPLALLLSHAASETLKKKDKQSLGDAIREARTHSGFWLLLIGFFVCGFQVQFINNHMENYLKVNMGVVGPVMAATAISLIGLFNMIGTSAAGYLGGKFRMKYLLSILYTARSFVFLAFFLLPLSKTTVILFACLVGILWLATVPLTSGIVAQIFGPRYMATLYGAVFLSHQIGSFTSVWLAGRIFDANQIYDVIWWLIISAGFVAALLHCPIDDKPVARLRKEQATIV